MWALIFRYGFDKAEKRMSDFIKLRIVRGLYNEYRANLFIYPREERRNKKMDNRSK
jgi:hypothetical protein